MSVRTVLEQKVPLVLAALAILHLVAGIPREAELLLSLVRHVAREDGEEILALRPGIISRDKPRGSTTILSGLRPRCLLICHFCNVEASENSSYSFLLTASRAST